jgi:hypothetical protein
VVIERGIVRATGTMEAITNGVRPENEYHVKTLAEPGAAERALLEQPGVRRVRRDGQRLVFTFAGGPEELAGLLETLVRRGLRPIEFGPEGADLEEAFLSLTEGRVQ